MKKSEWKAKFNYLQTRYNNLSQQNEMLRSVNIELQKLLKEQDLTDLFGFKRQIRTL